MAYVLDYPCGSEMIEQEFDLLDHKLSKGNSEEVISACEKILSSPEAPASKKSWAHLLLGTAYIESFHHAEALKNFQAIKDPPALLRPRVVAGAAKALAMVGRTDEALTLLNELLILDTSSWVVWEALGICLQAKGELEGAWGAFQCALEKNPASISVITAMEHIAMPAARYADLATALLAHLSADPSSLNFRASLAKCFLSMGELDQAKDELLRIISFAPFCVVDSEVVAAAQTLLAQLQEDLPGGGV